MVCRLVKVFLCVFLLLMSNSVLAQKMTQQEKTQFLNLMASSVKGQLTLPMEMFEGFWIQSVKTDGSNIIYTYKITNPSFKSMYSNPKTAKEQLIATMNNSITPEISSLLSVNNIGMTFKVIDESGKLLYNGTLTGSDFANASKTSTEDYIRQMAEAEKRNLPEDIGDGMYITDMFGRGNFMVYKISCPELMKTAFSAISQDDIAEMKKSLILAFNPFIRKRFADQGIGIMYEYYYKNSNILNVTITPMELEQYMDEPMQNLDDSPLSIENLAKESKSEVSLPVKIAEGYYLWDIIAEGDNLVYVYKVTTEELKFLVQTKAQENDEVETFFSEPDGRALLQICPMIIRYIDKNGKKIVDHKYTKDTLK